jgi:hypothetical protein
MVKITGIKIADWNIFLNLKLFSKIRARINDRIIINTILIRVK